MSKRTAIDLKELFKQASEIAQQVPESMQDAAFNRALDLLTGESQSSTEVDHPANRNTKKKSKTKGVVQNTEKSSADILLTVIDSTQHPGIKSASKVLDRALMVLQIAFTEHNIDRLTPNVIAKTLTEKFRISTTTAAVSMALGRVTDLVNRVPEGGGFVYKIMSPAEEYLAQLEKPESSVSPVSKPKKAKKKKSSSTATKKIGPKKKKGSIKKAKRKRSVGQKEAVINLIDAGYFDTGKTGPEVQVHLKSKRGLNFTIEQLLVVMLRLLRDNVLDRNENAEGQYEYTKQKS